MRLWTIHPVQGWKNLEEKGELHVDEKQLPYGDVPRSYRWLAERLLYYIPDYPGTLPWWAYTRKPDLRTFRFLRPSGQQVRIELELDASDALVFPSWAWHQVFSYDYLAKSRDEYEAWKNRVREAGFVQDDYPLPQPWQSELEKSWDRLFDVDLPHNHYDEYWEPCDPVAVLGILRLRNVRKTTVFDGICNLK